MASDKRSGPYQQIRQKLDPIPFRLQVKNSLEFLKICGGRTIIPLLVQVLVGLLAVAFFLSIWLSWVYVSFETIHPSILISFEEWPVILRFYSFFTLLATGFLLSITVLGTFRVVHRVRTRGRYKTKDVVKEMGYAAERVGVLGTAGWTLVLAMVVFSVLLLSYFSYFVFLDVLKLPPVVSYVAAITFAVAGLWLFAFFPQLYTMPVMLRRDCGWMKATEASFVMLTIIPRESFLRAALATVLAFTIIGLPASIHLLLSSLDRQDLLIAAILGEKSSREIREALEEEESNQPKVLQRYETLLNKGRYLDALNGYQMYLHNNRDDARAWRGESLALLHMGVPKARESLETWVRMDPDDPEAQQLLDEYNNGLWSEGGARYEEAQKKCTQHIGRGV